MTLHTVSHSFEDVNLNSLEYSQMVKELFQVGQPRYISDNQYDFLIAPCSINVVAINSEFLCQLVTVTSIST
jgi:hypothetical protein